MLSSYHYEFFCAKRSVNFIGGVENTYYFNGGNMRNFIIGRFHRLYETR